MSPKFNKICETLKTNAVFNYFLLITLANLHNNPFNVFELSFWPIGSTDNEAQKFSSFFQLFSLNYQ